MNNRLPFRKSAIEQSIVVRWQRIVRQFPLRIAVTTPSGRQYSYQQIEERSNQLAHALIMRLGVENCPLVLLLDHTPLLIISIMGTLKANKAYVVLDPTQADQQLQTLLATTASPLIVTTQGRRALAESIAGPSQQIVILESVVGAQTAPDLVILPDAPAALFLTSGTVGQPKGVLYTHRMILHRIWVETETHQLTARARISGLRTFNMAASIRDIFNALLNGGTLGLYSLKQDGLSHLSAWLLSQKITYFHLPILLYREWLDTLAPKDYFPDIQHIFPSGRKTASDCQRIWPHLAQGARFISTYATTETSLLTQLVLTRHNAVDSELLAVGQTIPDKQIMLLDEQDQPVKMGEVGQIVVRSRYIASGYWQQPELTAKHFSVVDAGHDEISQEISYRTGDIGRWRTDGALELLGRRDSQIKLRGYRVVLGELEDALQALPSIKEAVVTADAERGLLQAYLVAASDPPVPPDKIRETLANRLPDYLLPTHLIYLPHLPLLPSGKVNRQALPPPAQSRPPMGTPYLSPRDAIEKQLVTLWEEVLGINGIGVHDNFFDLGGHSLFAMQVISRIRDQFQTELPLRCLFDKPSIAGLAEQIKATKGNQILGAIEPIDRALDLPLSFAEERLWFLHQLEPDIPNYTLYQAFRLKGPLNVHALEKSFAELFTRHEGLRTNYKTQNGSPKRVIAIPSPFTLPVLDLSGLAEEAQKAEVTHRLAEEGRTRFDLEHDPLFRLTLLHLSPREHLLLMTTHHIIFDGWSMSVWWHELAALYKAFCRHQPSPLPDLTIQYADFAHWQRLRQDDILADQLDYWKNQLNGAPPLLELPTDHLRPSQSHYRGGSISFPLSAALTEAIISLNQQMGSTLFMTLLTAFKVLLFRYSAQDDIVVGTPIANRTTSQIEGLIGFFLNTLVLRTNLSGNPTFSQLLAKVQKVALGAYQHQDLPFEKLVEELQPERTLSYHPLFQVMFMLLDAAPKSFSLLDLDVTEEPKVRETAVFDLRVIIEESNEQFVARWDYNRDLFEAATIKRMAEHFQTLLEGIIANPETPIADLPLLTAAERHQLLVEWNDTATDYPVRSASISYSRHKSSVLQTRWPSFRVGKPSPIANSTPAQTSWLIT